MMKDFDVYLFDFDGTLVDSSSSFHSVFRRGFEAIGIKNVTDEECDECMHNTLSYSAKKKGASDEQIPIFIKALLEVLDDPEVIEKTKIFPETTNVINALLSKGKRIGIVSSNTEKHIKLVLKHLQIGDIFETYCGSDRYKRGKPYPDPILMAIEEMGLKPSSSIVYVGDSINDVLAGEAAGVETILIDRYGEHLGHKGSRIENLSKIVL